MTWARPRPGSQKRKGLGRNSPAKRGVIYAAEYSAWPHCKETLPDTWSCHQYISTPLPCSNIAMNLLHALLSSIWSVLHSFSLAPVFLHCPGAITAFSQSHLCPIPLAPSYPASFLPHLPFGHCCPTLSFERLIAHRRVKTTTLAFLGLKTKKPSIKEPAQGNFGTCRKLR